MEGKRNSFHELVFKFCFPSNGLKTGLTIFKPIMETFAMVAAPLRVTFFRAVSRILQKCRAPALIPAMPIELNSPKVAPHAHRAPLFPGTKFAAGPKVRCPFSFAEDSPGCKKKAACIVGQSLRRPIKRPPPSHPFSFLVSALEIGI